MPFNLLWIYCDSDRRSISQTILFCFLLFKKLPLYQLALSSFQCSRALKRSANLNKEKQFLSPPRQEQSKIGASGTRTIELMYNTRRLSEATDTALRVVPNKRWCRRIWSCVEQVPVWKSSRAHERAASNMYFRRSFYVEQDSPHHHKTNRNLSSLVACSSANIFLVSINLFFHSKPIICVFFTHNILLHGA